MDKRVWLTCCLLCSMQLAFGQVPFPPESDTNALKMFFFAGLREKLNENYPKAAENFTKILALEPNHAAANYEMAVINFRQNKLMDAEISIRKATVVEPDNIWYWRLLSELYKRKGDMDALVRVFDQMIRIDPEDASFYFDRSNAWLLGGKREEALKGYDELEKKFGSSDELLEARRRAAGEKAAAPDAGTAKLPAAVAGSEQALLNEGEKLYQQGDLAGALERFKGVLKQSDQIYAAWERTLHTQLMLGLYRDAIKTGDEALSLYPSQAALYHDMAIAQMNEGLLDEALSNIKMALQLQEDHVLMLETYGDILFGKGDSGAAVQQWIKSRAGGNRSDKLKKKIDEKKYIK